MSPGCVEWPGLNKMNASSCVWEVKAGFRACLFFACFYFLERELVDARAFDLLVLLVLEALANVALDGLVPEVVPGFVLPAPRRFRAMLR